MEKIKTQIEPIKKEYMVGGMTCASCVLRVEKALCKIDGIDQAKVNLATKKAAIYQDGESADFDTIKKVIQKAGYSLYTLEEAEEMEKKRVAAENRKLLLAWLITLPLSIKMLGEMIFGFYLFSPSVASYIDLAAAFIVIFIIGRDVLKSTFMAVASLSFNMDSLIGIGTLAAYVTGILNLAGIQIQNFSVVGAMIMSINFIGNYLKESATGKASTAIKKLLELGAKTAHLIEKDGGRDVAVEELHIGDVVLVRSGEKIPVDGVIVEGESSIEESIATGESIPVDKGEGDELIGGTVNQQGTLKVKITKIGKDTFLSQIIDLVEEAQNSEVPIQNFTDKVTAYFVPAVLTVSLLTFLFWILFPSAGGDILLHFSGIIPWVDLGRDRLSMALFAAIATLVIACPCALGLATPTALMVGMGKGAKRGILIRNGEAIQKAQSIDTVVFDKTGTITMGKPRVGAVIASDDDSEFLTLLASLEHYSEHPLGQMIVRYALEKGAVLKELRGVKSVTGRGIEGNLDGKLLRAGSPAYFSESGIDFSSFSESINEESAKGGTVILFGKNDKTMGLVSLHDSLKEDSVKAVERLKDMGVSTVMLTGDNRAAGDYIGKAVGIDTVFAELMPQDKIGIVEKLQNEGHVVAMVGDGINDAPALKKADVGIAIGTGTDIAIESSDITLVSGSVAGVYMAIELSRKTFKKIKQNLFWSFFYNFIAVPLAVLGLLHPAIAEIAMAMSSINVVANSMRLNGAKID
jgi:Cu+-exporting ATPase